MPFKRQYVRRLFLRFFFFNRPRNMTLVRHKSQILKQVTSKSFKINRLI